MKIIRQFLGWDSPFLPALSAALLEHRDAGGICDLRNLCVVLPGSRAARRLEELLARRAAEERVVLFPPQFLTPGRLPELLYSSTRPLAGPADELLCWQNALVQAPAEEINALMPTATSRPLNWNEALGLAQALQHLWHELSAAMLLFSQIRELCSGRGADAEHERWTALNGIFDRYCSSVEGAGLADIGWSRRQAVIAGAGADAALKIVLAGVVEIPRVHRELLAQSACSVSSCVFAPEEEQERFDEFGCLLPEMWNRAVEGLERAELKVLENAAGLGAAVRQSIAAAGPRTSSVDVTVGAADDEFSPYLQQQLLAGGIPAHIASGRPLSRAPLCVLTRELQAFTAARSFSAFASLLRLPLVEAALERSGVACACSLLDRYYQDALPLSVDDRLKASQPTASVVAAAEALFGPFLGPDVRSLASWAAEYRGLLGRVCEGAEDDDPDAALKEEVACLLGVLAELDEASNASGRDFLAVEFFSLLLARAASAALPSPQRQDSVELLSWLELALDDAPLLVVAGMNEPALPRAPASDPFLPESLRAELGLAHYSSRWARDAYLFQTMLKSKERISCLAVRHSLEGEAVSLSRLLLPGAGAEQAERLMKFYAPLGTGDRRLFFSDLSKAQSYRPPQLKPVSGKTVVMSVTSFRDYIECPYRYYLRHIYRLEPLDDRALEMDSGQFGTLIHCALERFGKSSYANLDDEHKIASVLSQLLADESERRFGGRPQPAVAVQVRQAQARLRQFAEWQAERRRQGWKIHEVELRFAAKDEIALPLSGGARLLLTGRIDRVDVHEPSGRISVLDYKTRHQVISPEKVHRTRDLEWLDLQLPLYVELLRSRLKRPPDELGYVCLPAAHPPLEQVLQLADWSASDLAAARDCACNIAAKLLTGEIPEPELLQRRSDPFAAICGEGMLHDLAVELEGEE